jgi:hypothetical protein
MSATNYKGKRITPFEMESGAIGILIDGQRVQGISAIFPAQAIDGARKFIDTQEVQA